MRKNTFAVWNKKPPKINWHSKKCLGICQVIIYDTYANILFIFYAR